MQKARRNWDLVIIHRPAIYNVISVLRKGHCRSVNESRTLFKTPLTIQERYRKMPQNILMFLLDTILFFYFLIHEVLQYAVYTFANMHAIQIFLPELCR